MGNNELGIAKTTDRNSIWRREKNMLWPWVYIVEENSNKIYVEEVLYSNRKKNRITHIRNV